MAYVKLNCPDYIGKFRKWVEMYPQPLTATPQQRWGEWNDTVGAELCLQGQYHVEQVLLEHDPCCMGSFFIYLTDKQKGHLVQSWAFWVVKEDGFFSKAVCNTSHSALQLPLPASP